MELSESPLDVLSRAATMVQDGLTSDETTSSKQLPTTKWKRDRRTSRLPEYSRKSRECSSPSSSSSSESSPTYKSSRKDAPLDMSVKPRGSPPSYSQAISNRSGYRPSVITTTTPPIDPKEAKSISMCDPIIDEHFRRSLGKDYAVLFANEEKKEQFREDPDNASLSVDDHFAKALGETWVQLKREANNGGGSPPPEKIRVALL